MTSIRKSIVRAAFKRKALTAFPPFEKGGQGGFALDLPARKAKQIPLGPPFPKGEETP
jgi:hypothetical protein